jgi:hypothetical protein
LLPILNLSANGAAIGSTIGTCIPIFTDNKEVINNTNKKATVPGANNNKMQLK